MSAYALRCRVCEEVTVAEPLDACRRCDGPTDVLYDWAWVEHAVTRAAVAVAAAAAATGLEAIVLAPVGGESAAVAARHPGARVFAVNGTYDDCRRLELELGALFPWGFVSGNLHPYASEGAKTISFEIAEQLEWQLPDAVVCPAASGTLFAKLAQGFAELTRAGLADEPMPRMFAGQALGSSPKIGRAHV